jgi:MFS family permease
VGRGTSQEDAQPFRVKSLTSSVYLPNLFFATGQGAVIPMLSLVALDLGASPAAAGAIVALRGLGTMAFDVPAGVLVARLGDRRAMFVATPVLVGVALAIAAGPSLPLYAGLVFLMGCAWSVWLLARLSYATEASPYAKRGRVMSMLGGAGRFGNFIGPLIGGAVVAAFGLPGPFFLQAAMATTALGILALTPGTATDPAQQRQVRTRQVLRDNRRVLLTVALAAVSIQILRSSRQAILPLWGDHIGLDASQVALVVSASSAVDMLLFYPMGMLSDIKGRRWVALPCIILLSLGLAMVPLTSSFFSLAVVAAFIGLGNGFGTGINNTLASDFSPDFGRNHFFGIWRLVMDSGTVGGPLLVAAATALVSLGASAVVVAGTGAAGALVLWRTVR